MSGARVVMRSVRTWISLCILTVWSGNSMSILWIFGVCLSWTLHRLHWVLTDLTPGWTCAPLLGTCCDSVHIVYV